MGTQNVLGVNYPYPNSGDEPYGTDQIAWTTAVSNATNTLNALTTSNVGSGTGLAKTKSVNTLPFKSIVAGSNITISAGTDDITINATGTLSGAPAGTDTQIQYNDAGVLGASSKFTYNNTTTTLTLGVENATAYIETPVTTTSNTSAGSLFIQTKQSNGTGDGGHVTMLTGAAATLGYGGSVAILCGQGAGAAKSGGNIDMSAGLGGGGGGTSPGGYVSFAGGFGAGAGGNGGAAYLIGGNAQAGNGNGGDIIFRPGLQHGSGTVGKIKFFNFSSGFYGIFSLAGLTANRTLTLPNNTGTFVLSVNGTPPDAAGNVVVSGGSGDVVGPSSATDNAVVRYDGTTGKLLQNSNWTLDDNGKMSATISTGEGLSIISSLGAGSGSDNLLYLQSTSASWSRPHLRIIKHISNTNGGAAMIRMDGTGVDIEFVDTGETTPAGKFEIECKGDQLRFLGRNAADNSFEPMMNLTRGEAATNPGSLGLGGVGYSRPNGHIEIVRLSTQAYINCSTAVGGSSGDIFTIDTNGGLIFNNTGAAVNARFESDTDANLLVTDGTNNVVNVGFAAADAAAIKKLNVSGEVRFGKASTTTGRISLGKSSSAGYTIIEGGTPGSDVTFTIPAITGIALLLNSAGQGTQTSDGITMGDAKDIVLNTTTGTKIGTGTTQKLGFWNATPVVKPATGGAASTFVANTSLIANDTATFDSYTIGQVVKALRNVGILT